MHPRLRHALTSTTLPLAVVLALAGCGSGGAEPAAGGGPSSSASSTTAPLPTAQELMTTARTAALAAKSTHVTGTVTDEGRTMDVDLSGRTDGTNQSLRIGLGSAQEVTILTLGSKYYLLGNDEFWTEQGGGTVAAMLKDKYVLVPAAQAKDFGDMTIKSLLEEMFGDADVKKIGSSGTVAKGRLDGDEVYTITGQGGAQEGQLFVSADGKATLRKVIGPRDDPGQLTFTEWDQVKDVQAPPAAKVIEMPR